MVLGWVMYFSVGQVHVFALLYLDRRAVRRVFMFCFTVIKDKYKPTSISHFNRI